MFQFICQQCYADALNEPKTEVKNDKKRKSLQQPVFPGGHSYLSNYDHAALCSKKDAEQIKLQIKTISIKESEVLVLVVGGSDNIFKV